MPDPSSGPSASQPLIVQQRWKWRPVVTFKPGAITQLGALDLWEAKAAVELFEEEQESMSLDLAEERRQARALYMRFYRSIRSVLVWNSIQSVLEHCMLIGKFKKSMMQAARYQKQLQKPQQTALLDFWLQILITFDTICCMLAFTGPS